MKTLTKMILRLLFMLLTALSYAQVGIGTETPEPSAILELKSDDKTLLLPRLNGESTVTNPLDGMVIYVKNQLCFKGYQTGRWIDLSNCNALPPNESIVNVTFVSANNPDGADFDDGDGEGFAIAGKNLTTQSITVSYEVTDSNAIGSSFILSVADINSSNEVAAEFRFFGTITSIGTFTVELLNDSNALVTPSDNLMLPITGGNTSESPVASLGRVDILSLPSTETQIVDIVVTDGTNTQIWMDRNLGAIDRAISFNSATAYGNYYQWGRFSDGHERVIVKFDGSDSQALNGITNNRLHPNPANNSQPEGSQFAGSNNTNQYWMDPTLYDLWDGTNTTIKNNPCPSGYRLPSNADWELYETIFTNNDPSLDISGNGTFGEDLFNSTSSTLFLPMSGSRGPTGEGTISDSTNAFYWTSEVDTSNDYPIARRIRGVSGSTNNNGWTQNSLGAARRRGYSIRCIKGN
jgi:uncharacterized protein (TIGR02145 family)